MSNLVRKQFYISQFHNSLLKRKAKELGIKETELVRKALDLSLKTIMPDTKSMEKWQEETKFIQDRMRQANTDRGVRTWKREDLYDR